MKVDVEGWKRKQLLLLREVIGLGDVENLELTETSGSDKPSFTQSDLQQILSASTLKSLTLDPRLLVRVSPKFLSNKVKKSLSALTTLVIGSESDPGHYYFGVNVVNSLSEHLQVGMKGGKP